MMNKKTVQILAILILVAAVWAETVDLNGNSGRKAEAASVQLADGLIAPWAWKNVKEAVDGVAKQADLTINYSALNSVQLDLLTTRNVVLESRKPLHWKVLLSEILRGLEFDYIQNDAGVVEIMPFDRFHAYKTEEAERVLQNNHKMIEVTFNRMPLLQALKELTEQAGVSLNTGYLPLEVRDPDAAAKAVAAPAADAKTPAAPPPPVKIYETSFKTVTPMEWRNVLKNILDPDGYDFVEMGGAVCPMDKSKTAAMKASLLAAKPLIRQVVPLYYATPTDLMARIKELGILSPRGQLSLTQSVGQNTKNEGASTLRPRVREDIIVSDVEANVLLASEWIRKLDVSDGQVMIEARILSISDTDTKKLGIDWTGLDGANLLSLGFVENIGRIKNLDYLRNDVKMLTPGGTTVAGTAAIPAVPGSTTVIGGVTTVTPAVPAVPAVPGLVTDANGYYHGQAATALLGPVNLKATLHALDKLVNVEVLSHPLVVLGNRTESKIDVQTIYPTYSIRRNTQTAGDNGAQTQDSTVEWLDVPVGLTLWISPEISPDSKHVRLSVNQIMTDKLDPAVEPLDPDSGHILGSKYVIASRKLDTRAMVRDGDTLVIGGLVTTTHSVTDSKVPFLGSIPLLGRLFSYKDDQVVKNNLVIMITPTILDEDTPATGYEPKSEAKANELSALGKDYFYNKPEKTEDGDQGTGGVKPKEEIKLSEEAKLKPAEESAAEEAFQTLEAGK